MLKAPFGDRGGLDLEPLPPSKLVAGLVQLPVTAANELAIRMVAGHKRGRVFKRDRCYAISLRVRLTPVVGPLPKKVIPL